MELVHEGLNIKMNLERQDFSPGLLPAPLPHYLSCVSTQRETKFVEVFQCVPYNFNVQFIQICQNLTEIKNEIFGKIWQEVSRQILLKLESSLNNEPDIEKFRHLLMETEPIEHLVPVHKCLWYILNTLEINTSTNKSYTAMVDLVQTLPSPSYKPSEVISSYTLTVLPTLASSLSSLSVSSQPLSSLSKTPGTCVAMETDRVRLAYPIISAVHTSLWSVSQWLIQTIKESILNDRLQSVVFLLFEEGSLVLEKGREIVKMTGTVGITSLPIPAHTSQYLVAKWSRCDFDNLYNCYQWIESQLCDLCHMFFEQFKEKCCQIINICFNQRDINHSFVTVLQQQILEPLINSAAHLKSIISQKYFIQLAVSVLLLELRNALTSKFSSIQEILQLKSGFHQIMTFLTNRSNGLHQSTQAMIPLLGICCDIETGLSILCREEDPVSIDSNEMEGNGCQDLYLLKLTSKLDILQQVAWLDHNQWKKLIFKH